MKELFKYLIRKLERLNEFDKEKIRELEDDNALYEMEIEEQILLLE